MPQKKDAAWWREYRARKAGDPLPEGLPPVELSSDRAKVVEISIAEYNELTRRPMVSARSTAWPSIHAACDAKIGELELELAEGRARIRYLETQLGIVGNHHVLIEQLVDDLDAVFGPEISD